MAVFFLLLLSTFPHLIFSISIQNYTQLPLPPPVTSPESLAFQLLVGDFYTGVSDGRILKYRQLFKSFVNFGDAAISIQTGDSTAELLEYNPVTKEVKKLLTGLSGAVGVATDPQASFVLVSEFIGKRIRKLYLTGGKAGTSELFLRFAGNPNKIKRNGDGNFWVSVNNVNNDSTYSPQGVKFDSNGKILATVNFTEYKQRLTIVQEQQGKLYIGGKNLTAVGRYDIVYP